MMMQWKSKALLAGCLALAMLAPVTSAFACHHGAWGGNQNYRNAYYNRQPYYVSQGAYGGPYGGMPYGGMAYGGGSQYGSGSWLRNLINPYGGGGGNYYASAYNMPYPPGGGGWGGGNHRPCHWDRGNHYGQRHWDHDD